MENESKKNPQYLVINEETGEVVDENLIIQTHEQQRENIEKSRKKRERKLQYEDAGHFYFLFYDEKCFSSLDGPSLFRLLYLASYLQYREQSLKLKGDIILQNDISEILNLSDKAAKNFIDKCIQAKFITIEWTENKPVLYLSKEFFYRGDLTKTLQIKSPIRIYIEAIKKLYRHYPNEAKTLSYIFKLIPYLNKKWNIVCLNPEETDLEHLQYITSKKLSEIWEYNLDHLNRLKQKLLEYSIDGAPIISFHHHADTKTWKIWINPTLCYQGKDLERAKMHGIPITL